MKNITKHNRPIKTVLKEYVERHKGKIVESAIFVDMKI